MKKFNIPISRTELSASDISSVSEVLKSGWLVQGKKVKEFEDEWSQYTGAKFSIAVTSCTSAMHLSLEALGLSEKDEIIVPAFTWISTANVVEHVGAKLKFCDIDLETFNINIDQLKSSITSKTKAIIPVHLFGLPANMKEIVSLAKERDLFIIEDAACGFASFFQGKHAGTFGDTGCFSFHPRKSITTGEGGMITTNNKKLAEKIKSIRDHGAVISDHQRHLGPKPYLLSDHKYAGYNQRMTDIQASLGLEQMKRRDSIIQERKKIAEIYNSSLKEIEWLNLPFKGENYSHGYQSYPCLFNPEVINIKNVEKIKKLRNKFMDYLLQKGISTRPSTHAVHMLNFYRKKYSLSKYDYPNSLFANNCSISLPLFNGMKKNETEYVIQTVRSYNFS